MEHSLVSHINKGCSYCGNNPTNHTMTYIAQSIPVLGLPFLSVSNFLARPFFSKIIHNTIVRGGMWGMQFCGVATFGTDKEKACSGRSKVVWEEAIARGIPMEQLYAFGKPVEQYRAYLKGQWHYFTSIPIPPHADRRSYLWMDDKVKLKEFLELHDVHVSKGGSVRTKKEALAMFKKIGKPVIVKPVNGSRGRHSLTHLTTEADVAHGFKIAKQLCISVMVEEHLHGSVYRGTYVGGEIVGVLRGDPPKVTGNGTSTVAELIAQKNAQRPPEVNEVVQSDVITECIARQGYTYESVLPAGTTIDLLEKIGLSYGGDAVEEYPLAHPKLLAELKKAGDVLNAPVIGFDFISSDITADPDTVTWGIIEANSMPFIDLHHDPRKGTPINVAGKVWDMWN